MAHPTPHLYSRARKSWRTSQISAVKMFKMLMIVYFISRSFSWLFLVSPFFCGLVLLWILVFLVSLTGGWIHVSELWLGAPL